MFKFLSVFLILLIPFQSFADFDYLNKDQKAPYEGYLITPEREQSLRLLDKKLQISDNIIQSYERLDKYNQEQIDILSKRIELHQKENERLSQELSKNRSSNFWEYTLYFTLGAVLTGLIAQSVK